MFSTWQPQTHNSDSKRSSLHKNLFIAQTKISQMLYKEPSNVWPPGVLGSLLAFRAYIPASRVRCSPLKVLSSVIWIRAWSACTVGPRIRVQRWTERTKTVLYAIFASILCDNSWPNNPPTLSITTFSPVQARWYVGSPATLAICNPLTAIPESLILVSCIHFHAIFFQSTGANSRVALG